MKNFLYFPDFPILPQPALETTILIFLMLKNPLELEVWGLGCAGATGG